jgi:hypothetical protein
MLQITGIVGYAFETESVFGNSRKCVEVFDALWGGCTRLEQGNRSQAGL